jgi:acyl-CoA reductase-like NAD-dependent aldehyde dehydrogenase
MHHSGMHPIFINGGWVPAQGPPREVKNPATLELLGTVPECGPAEVERAVAAARAAQIDWCRVPAADRQALLIEIGARIRASKPDLATLLTRESGKPLCESGDCIDAAARIFEASAESVLLFSRAIGTLAGVVAAIMPFNFPLLFTACAVAPALAAGNTLVCKPPQQNPLTNLKMAELYGSLPAGVVNLITGGAETGRALIGHPDIALVRFTGSAAVGRSIAAATPAERIDLALGAVDAFIVCEDANLDLTVPGIAWARLMNAGQVCLQGQHIYVARSIAAEFADRMHQCVGFLDVDDPMKRPTDLGPLISLEAAHRVEDQVGRTLREGATLILGGRRFRPSGLPGHFFQPTILSNVQPGGVPTREEILGPVVTITPVSGVSQAIRWTSESRPDFRASIYTSDPQAALNALEPVQLGNFRINDPVSDEDAGPFTGLRCGQAAHVSGLKCVQVAAKMERKPWWFPYRDRVVASGAGSIIGTP